MHTSHPSSCETEAEGSGVQDHPWLRNEFKVNLSYMRTRLKQNKQTKEK